MVWISGVAAAFIGLLLVLNVSLMTKPPETEVLFAQYVEEAKSTAIESEEIPRDVYSDIFRAIEQYEANDYQAAIRMEQTAIDDLFIAL